MVWAAESRSVLREHRLDVLWLILGQHGCYYPWLMMLLQSQVRPVNPNSVPHRFLLNLNVSDHKWWSQLNKQIYQEGLDGSFHCCCLLFLSFRTTFTFSESAGGPGARKLLPVTEAHLNVGGFDLTPALKNHLLGFFFINFISLNFSLFFPVLVLSVHAQTQPAIQPVEPHFLFLKGRLYQ